MRSMPTATSSALRVVRNAPVTSMTMVRPRRAAPADAARVTRAEVSLAHVRHNYRELSACLRADAEQLGRPAAAVWGVLKADGYGHGAAAIATALQNDFEFWADNQDELNERFNTWLAN